MTYDVTPLAYLLRSGDDHILANRQFVERSHDVNCCPALIVNVGQDDQKVQVAIRPGVAARPGAEEDDLQRLESGNDTLDGFGQAIGKNSGRDHREIIA